MSQTLEGVKVYSSEDARHHWRDVLDRTTAGRDAVVARHGKPIAAIIPYEDYEALIDALDDLRDGRTAAVRAAEYDRDPSVARDYDEIRAEMMAEGRLSG